MSVPLIPFEMPNTSWPNHPFPREYATDGFILFHGTSSTQEAAIDANGLIPTESRFRKADLEQLVALFRSIDWVSLRSYTVLRLYSLDYDYAHPQGKPVYLAEGAKHALGYAEIEFAGGEIARSVRYAFEDLRSYIENPSVRAAHIAEDEAERISLRRLGAIEPKPLPSFDPNILRSALDEMAQVEKTAVEALTGFTHGVVYAVRIKPEDLESMECGGSMSIKCFQPLGPDRLVAKMRVPKGYAQDCMTKDADGSSLPSWDGVIARLRSSSI